MILKTFSAYLAAIFLILFCTDIAANQSCPDGQRKGPDTQGNCCWADQVWVNNMCVGEPSCPTGFVTSVTQEGLAVCETQACPTGMERQFDNVNCCWPGQGWSLSKNACVGPPQCPPDHVVEGNQCVSAADLKERRATEVAFKRARLSELESQARDLAMHFKSLFDSYKWDYYSDGRFSSSIDHQAEVLGICEINVAESKIVPKFDSSGNSYRAYEYQFSDCNVTVNVGAQRRSNDDERFDFSCISGECPDNWENDCANVRTPDALTRGNADCTWPKLKSFAQCASHNVVAENFSKTCYEWRQLKAEIGDY